MKVKKFTFERFGYFYLRFFSTKLSFVLYAKTKLYFVEHTKTKLYFAVIIGFSETEFRFQGFSETVFRFSSRARDRLTVFHNNKIIYLLII